MFVRLLILVIALSHASAAQEAEAIATSKPGRCTPMKLTSFSLCYQRYDLCQDDFQCPGDFKCCPRPCGHVCQAPLNGTKAELIKMTSAKSTLVPPELDEEYLAPQQPFLQPIQPFKKTIDPYSYMYNQMTKNQNRYSAFNPYKSFSPSRLHLLNAQRFMPYSNMVMRTKSLSRNNKLNRGNVLMDKLTKLSSKLRKPAAASAKCDCEEKKKSGSIRKLSNRLSSKKLQAYDETPRVQDQPEQVQTLSMAEPVLDALEAALPDQVPPSQPAEATFKPGVCPNKFTFGRCLLECYQDSDCEGNKICCHSGCGYSCAIPVEEKRVAGKCPNNKNRIFKCTSPKPSCMRDRDCAYGEKCCSIGCQYTCMRV